MRARHRFLEHSGVVPFAHRGGALEAPENTMPAFEAAVDLGFHYLETDVRTTRDGEVVLFHDALLDRVTDRSGPLAHFTLRQLRSVDAGHGFSTDFGVTFPYRERGVRIPTVDELLERFPDARINLDPKEDRAVSPLLAVLRRHNALHRVCIGSFSDRRLAQVRALAGGRVCTAMGKAAVGMVYLRSRQSRAHMPRLNADCVQVPTRWRVVGIVDSRFVAAAHAAGLPVHVWTVNDAPGIESLLELGVDGIMTDRPTLLRDVLQRRGLWDATHNRRDVVGNAAG